MSKPTSRGQWQTAFWLCRIGTSTRVEVCLPGLWTYQTHHQSIWNLKMCEESGQERRKRKDKRGKRTCVATWISSDMTSLNIQYFQEHTLCYVVKCILIDHPFKNLGRLAYFRDVIILWQKHYHILTYCILPISPIVSFEDLTLFFFFYDNVCMVCMATTLLSDVTVLRCICTDACYI